MYSPEVELADNPVLNLLIVNKWMRREISRLMLLARTIPQWQDMIEEESGVHVPLDVVENLCRGNNLTVLKITKGEF